MDASVPPPGGGPGGPGGPSGPDGPGEPAGGGGAGEPSRRAFAAGYKIHSGDMMVYGGGAMTVLGVLAMVLTGRPEFLLISVVGTLSALYFWPLVDSRTPQLAANADGLYVARIGLIPWSAITSLRVRRQALRTMRLATLVVELDRPLAEALIEADTVPLTHRFTARNSRVRDGRVEVTLHTLGMKVDDIEARLGALRPPL